VSSKPIGEDEGGVYVCRFELDGDEYAVLSIPADAPALPASLTEAERQICQLVFEGASNAAIARRRGTSVRTVANQLASIYQKLGVSSRIELVARLHEHEAE
jgi:DNA-binding NarL/FixJ family response regulator